LDLLAARGREPPGSREIQEWGLEQLLRSERGGHAVLAGDVDGGADVELDAQARQRGGARRGLTQAQRPPTELGPPAHGHGAPPPPAHPGAGRQRGGGAAEKSASGERHDILAPCVGLSWLRVSSPWVRALLPPAPTTRRPPAAPAGRTPTRTRSGCTRRGA